MSEPILTPSYFYNLKEVKAILELPWEVPVFFYISDVDKKIHIVTYNEYRGDAMGCVLPPLEEILAELKKTNSTKVLLVHNHPGKNSPCTPSNKDLIATERLSRDLRKHGMILVDHLIVTKNGYYSFFADGRLWNVGSNKRQIFSFKTLLKTLFKKEPLS